MGSSVEWQGLAGMLLEDRYLLERELGRGGLGVVYAATDRVTSRPVAIKLMQEVSYRAAKRLYREARMAALVRGDHVVEVLGLGSDAAGPFIVMELLQGHDLGEELARRGKLPFPVAVEYILQACSALEGAHAVGVVHRDIKPQNLFLTRTDHGESKVVVLDFGVAKHAWYPNAVDRDLTRTGSLVGTPLYMSPEQVRDAREVDARSDIWALGAVSYELVCGRVPFKGATAESIGAAIVTDQPTPPRQLTPSLPAGLEAVLLQCLQKDAAARPGSVRELMAALAPFASSAARRSLSELVRNAAEAETIPPTANSHTSHSPPRPPAHSGVRRSREPGVKGSVQLTDMLVMRELCGDDAVDRALSRLSLPAREELRGLTAVSWCSVAASNELLVGLASELGEDPIAVQQRVVRRSVERTLTTFWRVMIRMTSDQAVMARTAALYNRTMNTGTLRSTFGHGCAELFLEEWPDIPELNVRGLALGIESVLQLGGRGRVSVSWERTASGVRYFASWQP